MQRPSMVRGAALSIAAIALVALMVGSGLSLPAGRVPSLGSATGRSIAAFEPASSPRPDTSFAPRPVLGLLSELNGLVGANNVTIALNFTVPSGVWDVVYVWGLSGGLGTFQPPVLPSGLTLVEYLGSAGMALGNLSAGTYATSLTYPGWTNTFSIAVYGIFNGSGATFQFANTSVSNPHPGIAPDTASVALPAHATEYLGIVGTGGFQIGAWSMTIEDVEAPAWTMPGYTDIIGAQLNDTFSETSYAAGMAVVGMGIYPGGALSPAPMPILLAGFSRTAGGNGLSFPLNFTVPSGVQQVLYVWALAGGLGTYQSPTLPSGLKVVEMLGGTGMAYGNLSTGTYATTLSYPGWTNTVDLAVYGILGGANADYVQFGANSASNPNPYNASFTVNLTMPAGSPVYIGVAATGGHSILNWTMPAVDEMTEAWEMPGYAQVIGRQAAPVLSATSEAGGMAVLGMGIYSYPANITFQENGLKPGAKWTVVFNGTTQTTTATSVTFRAALGSNPYLIVGPKDYQVSSIAPIGTVVVPPGNSTKSVGFVRGPTLTFGFTEKGLPPGSTWCMVVGGLAGCSNSTSLKVANLTSATYPYRVASPTVGQTITARVGKTVEPTSGAYALTKSTTMALTFTYLYNLTFNETGLGSGTWSITVKGILRSAPAGASIVFRFPNGTYAYKVGKEPGYASLGSPTKGIVNGGPGLVNVTFALRV